MCIWCHKIGNPPRRGRRYNSRSLNLVNGVSALGVSITSGFGGRGNTLVRYSVQAHTRTVDADGYLEIAGLSGLNPNGRHHVVIVKR